jgi:hypothetical protein
MIVAQERPVSERAELGKPPLPREHGAWGILLIPFATAVGVSGVFDLKVTLLLASVLCFYVARASYLKQNWKWTVVLLAGSAACTAALLLQWRLWWLITLGAAATPLAFRRTERSIAVQLIAVAGLTLTAPATWYAATGRMDAKALWLWLLNALYFGGGVFYVKMHVAAAIRRRAFHGWREKMGLGAGTLLYYTGAMVCLGVLAAAKAIPAAALIAFAPVIARAVVGVGRLSPTLRIKRLGWTEVAYSLVFAASLIALLRGCGWGG